MTAECCESFAGTDMRGETIPDSRSSIINYRTNACCYFVSCNVYCATVCHRFSYQTPFVLWTFRSSAVPQQTGGKVEINEGVARKGHS